MSILSALVSIKSYPAIQNFVIISGILKDTTGIPVENITVTLSDYKLGTYTDINGNFSIRVPNDGQQRQLNISATGYEIKSITVVCDRNIDLGVIIIRRKVTGIGEITVTAERLPVGVSMIRISPQDFTFLPSASGGFEAVLKTLPGVKSGNELSSQYSVRGGNFDENLVYINDIEVFRPFLIRSGQQEGLSVINPDLVASVLFSQGGFSSVYGDRMSSVLDITYKRPVEQKGSVSAGMLYNTGHYEGTSRSGKVAWLSGVRYKSSRMMLKTLDSKGDYQPIFADIQSLVTIRPGRNSEFSFFGSYSSNTYNYVPTSRESKFGNEAEAYRLYVIFEGKEKDRYQTWNSAATWKYSGIKFSHKIILSSFGTTERESFDIRGFYSLNTLDKNTGSENFTDTTLNIGIGSFLSHARNKINAGIISVNYAGESAAIKNLTTRWGLKVSHKVISDNMLEWKIVDSAGFSIPYNPENNLIINSIIKGKYKLISHFAEAYIEIQKIIKKEPGKIIFTGGTRGIYNSFTSEVFACPRVSVKMETGKNLSLWMAYGAYFQPPFYKEMRLPEGTLNSQIKSQKSYHSVVGMSYDFKAWERPFRFTAEAYNKKLTNIIPYRLDNVRIIYEGINMASGYSRGIDLRLNGEFVEGAESWFSLSVMDSRLKIPELGRVMFPSPSDQTFSLNIFFQDYLPGNPSYRAHINIAFVTGLPVTSPFNNRYDQYHRLPPYRRVDLGLTKVIRNADLIAGKDVIKEVIASLEIFNLLDINNTVSYFWVKTVNNQSGRSRYFAIPDYLTGRSLNLKISVFF
ncbi:MAG: TonB-dependent receptor [Bacteroidales bacterium]